jgi:hypothetical protein
MMSAVADHKLVPDRKFCARNLALCTVWKEKVPVSIVLTETSRNRDRRIAWGLLYVLLLTAASGALVHSTVLNSALRPALQSLLPAAAAALPAAVSSTTQFARVSLAVALAGMAQDVRVRALRVETDSPDKVFAYYMHIWNIFYACYLLLPCLRV